MQKPYQTRLNVRKSIKKQPLGLRKSKWQQTRGGRKHKNLLAANCQHANGGALALLHFGKALSAESTREGRGSIAAVALLRRNSDAVYRLMGISGLRVVKRSALGAGATRVGGVLLICTEDYFAVSEAQSCADLIVRVGRVAALCGGNGSIA